jgi:transketolase
MSTIINWNRTFTESRDPRKTFGEALTAVGAEFPKVVAISTDSSSGSGMGPFSQKFPERHFEFGIMEQGAIGYAAGLASTGLIPFYAAIAPFVTARPFEMFRNDLGYMHQNVKVVGRCAGLTYSHLGPTHHSLDDIAIIRTIPGVTILNPGDPVSIHKAVRAAAQIDGPLYMRIGSPPMPGIFNDDLPFEVGKGNVMMDGSDVTIIASGTMLANAAEAAMNLEAAGISVRLVDMHTIKPLDIELVLESAEKTGLIVTVEEHLTSGGLGSAVAEVCAEQRPTRMHMIGVRDQFCSNGPYDELIGLYGLQAGQIEEKVKSLLK